MLMFVRQRNGTLLLFPRLYVVVYVYVLTKDILLVITVLLTAAKKLEPTTGINGSPDTNVIVVYDYVWKGSEYGSQ